MSESKPLYIIDKQVFIPSVSILVLIVTLSALWPSAAGEVFQSVQNGIVKYASWYYVLVVAIILVTVTLFTFSRYGDIKLGPDHSEPDYSFMSWFAMLFSAGMGIGLMFFGVAEPVMHFLNPPNGLGGTPEAAAEAMRLTFFHWGIHAWAMYAIVALILAYFAYRHDLPLTMRSSLYPLIGDRIYGPMGAAIDVFAILGTVCGVATSLGLGVLQINAGLNHLFDVPLSTTVQMSLVVFTITLATFSVILGLDAGIKRLSELNIALAVLLLIAVLCVGPTVYLLQAFVQNTGNYLSDLVSKTFNLYAYNPTDWIGGWTIFYWGWWLSWAPFVGLFIARISRGRTIREFVVGAMLGPTLFTLFWMTVFGNSGIDLILNQGMTSFGDAVQADTSVALFQFFESFPFSEILSLIAIIMVIVFFVTSADSGALVVNMLSAYGEDNTPIMQRAIWTIFIGLIAMVLLLAGGLKSLQTAAIASALPFSLALLFAMWGFGRALSADVTKKDALAIQVGTDVGVPWQQRLQNLIQYPTVASASDFQRKRVVPAMDSISEELTQQGLESIVKFSAETGTAELEVLHGEEIDFIYRVITTESDMPHDAMVSEQQPNVDSDSSYFRAEVHLREGGQDYDIMGWNKSQIIGDILDQYERHLHFLHLVR
ncbi:MAG: choline/glycine/proline betaine transport protein [Candidatus Azotimanducaceae bacterium]|jgi:choline/glycine/proline betaine transport protein